MAREEQAFRATYTYQWDAPTKAGGKVEVLETETDEFIDAVRPTSGEIVRFAHSSDVADALTEIGVLWTKIEVERSVLRERSDKRFDKAGRVLAGELDREGQEGCHTAFNTWNTFVVETPSSLGIALHKARRQKVERFFRDFGVAFVLECQTLHSSATCAPIRDDEPVATSPQLEQGATT